MDWLSSIQVLVGPVGPPWLAIAVGSVLLLFGRRLYGLLLASVGFAVGFLLVDRFAVGVSPEATWILALALGVAGAVLAFFVHRVALAIAGFLVSGLSTLWLVELLGIELRGPQLLLVLVGALLGLFAFRSLFRAALVVFSTLIGATWIVQATGFEPPLSMLLLLGLSVIGIFFQRDRGSHQTRRRARRRARRLRNRATIPET